MVEHWAGLAILVSSVGTEPGLQPIDPRIEPYCRQAVFWYGPLAPNL